MIKKSVEIAKDAGKILMKYYGKTSSFYKGENFDIVSIVSEADIKSEEFIVKKIKKYFPSHGIYGEEKTRDHLESDFVWYIDPLDGTSNFLRNIPLFGISIGLLHKGKPILGVLHFPALKLTVYAEKGRGAYANGKKIHVSKRDINKSLYYSGGYYKGKLQLEKKLGDKLGMTKIIDASSYEFAQIAMGDAELYVLVNVIHDVAAGVIIVEEAGGKITDREGKEWSISSKEIVASNGIIHKEVIKLLTES